MGQVNSGSHQAKLAGKILPQKATNALMLSPERNGSYSEVLMTKTKDNILLQYNFDHQKVQLCILLPTYIVTDLNKGNHNQCCYSNSVGLV